MNDIEVMQYFLQRKADNEGKMIFGNIMVTDDGEIKVSVHERGQSNQSTFVPEFFQGIKSAIARSFQIHTSQYSSGVELTIKCQDLYVKKK